MLKYILALMVSGPLLAETIGHVEFQFPPSQFEWRLLADQDSICNLFKSEDEDEEESDDLEFVGFKMFTHREGDAMEIFMAVQIKDDEEDEIQTLESAQRQMNETFNRILPNHKFIIQSYQKDENGAFVEMEVNDGVQDMMHVFTRALVARNEEGKLQTVLSYMTTAQKSEHNRLLWTEVLNQAK
jgi:hypothetical protein